MEFCTEELRGKKLGCIVKKLAFTVTVYTIWRERNNRVLRKEYKPKEVIVQDIINMIRGRVLSIRINNFSNEDRWILNSWNLPNSILK